jgi:hypothetical protein
VIRAMFRPVLMSGAEGARTPDLRAASATLSQLSYSPTELVVGGVLYRDFLMVGRGDEPKMDDLPTHNIIDRQQVAAVGVR